MKNLVLTFLLAVLVVVTAVSLRPVVGMGSAPPPLVAMGSAPPPLGP
jgi:hypothetical protein